MGGTDQVKAIIDKEAAEKAGRTNRDAKDCIHKRLIYMMNLLNSIMWNKCLFKGKQTTAH